MTNPARIQLRRTKGWRMPPNTVHVGRPFKWGNPFVVGTHGDAATCVSRFTALADGLIDMHTQPAPNYLDQTQARNMVKFSIHTLRGKNLACWCKPEQPCHADVLLKLANKCQQSMHGTHSAIKLDKQ